MKCEISLASEAEYSISRYDDSNNIVAARVLHQISQQDFNRDVAALAARLPDHKYMLNICTDRYRFVVGFLAALVREQISLLPSSNVPAIMEAVAEDYPDLYVLTDTTPPPMRCLIYPDSLDDSGVPVAPRTIPQTQPAAVLFTSGSTGKPKPVPKSWGALVRSARAAGERLGIAHLRNATVIGTVPHHHSYGIESIIFLCLQHGLIVDAGWPLYPADIRAALERAQHPRILVTTPVHLRALMAEPNNMPQVDLILSATAPLPASLAVEAETCFGAPLIEIYGCTEAGQVATRRTAHETEWQCLDGVDLSQDEQGTWASGAAVEGRALLHDIIEQTGPATFLLGDRSADLVDVAGKRTSLAHLNHQLLSITGVKDGAFVMGEAGTDRVARLMALVVAPQLTSGTILQALRERIDAAFLPRPLVFVDALPRNALGKLPREALLRLADRSRDV